MAWLGLYGFAWTDYEHEAQPAFDALVRGHLVEFLQLAPAYGGSLVLRAPFALLPGLWGGGELSVYRMVALPCLVAGAVLGVWLVARMRAEQRSTLARAVTLGVCVANPLTLLALEFGHPEEVLGASLCVAAVLLAMRSSMSRGRAFLVGAILGLAIANKAWALLALGPVLLALPERRRPPALASAGAVTTAILAPIALVGSSTFVAGTRAFATASGAIFKPFQVWWFFGASNHAGSRVAPSWLSGIPHPLILTVGLALTVVLWLRLRRSPRGQVEHGLGAESTARRLSGREALLALALLLLLRCLLDTWDAPYYPLAFIFVLLAWEVSGPADRPPVLALSSTVLAWISFQWLHSHASPDFQSAFFLAWSVPLAVALGLMLFRPRRSSTPQRSWIVWCARGQEMTVRALDRAARTSLPSSTGDATSPMRIPRRRGT
jgi:hypothetical protein